MREFSLSLSLSMCACECQKGARVREKRGHRGISSFLSSPRRMVVHRLLIRFIFNSTERKAIVRGHDSSRCVKTVGSYIGFSLSTKMEQETKKKKKKRKEIVSLRKLDWMQQQQQERNDVTKTSSTISRFPSNFDTPVCKYIFSRNELLSILEGSIEEGWQTNEGRW